MQNKKNPISINEGFTCSNCTIIVEKANKTCRNHCNQCLYSLHIDKNIPGDRASTCLNLMEPIALEINKKGYVIVHKCMKCGKIQKNKTADDDNFEKLTILMKKTNENNLKN